MLLLLSSCADTEDVDAGIDVMTFNVMCVFCGGDEYDPWETRLAYFKELWSRHPPDLMGLQELSLESDLQDVLRVAAGFEAIVYRDTDQTYADAAILYRRDRFDVETSGFYWLSPTPDEVYSTGFAAGRQLPRLVAWAVLLDRVTNEPLFFATTHFDNNSPSQAKSAPLVIERTAEPASRMPVIITGDFNSQPADPAYVELAGAFRNTFDLADNWSNDTNQDPPASYDLDERIDHVFVGGPVTWRVPTWTVDTHVYGSLMQYPSDHRAMITTVEPQR